MKKAPRNRRNDRSGSSASPNSNRPLQKRKWILRLAGLVILGVGVGVWALAQPARPPEPKPDPIKARLGEPDESPAKRAQRELARLAILEPAAFAKDLEKRKTPQEIQQEQVAIFSITQPKAYGAEFERFKDAARRQQEQLAREAILDPVRHSGPVRKVKEQPTNPAARP